MLSNQFKHELSVGQHAQLFSVPDSREPGKTDCTDVQAGLAVDNGARD